jgi:hypothetical protein
MTNLMKLLKASTSVAIAVAAIGAATPAAAYQVCGSEAELKAALADPRMKSYQQSGPFERGNPTNRKVVQVQIPGEVKGRRVAAVFCSADDHECPRNGSCSHIGVSVEFVTEAPDGENYTVAVRFANGLAGNRDDSPFFRPHMRWPVVGVQVVTLPE